MNETIRRAICRSGGTRGGVFPYRKQKTPQFDDRIRKQRVAYANYSPIGLAARDGRFDEEKEGWIFWDHTPTSKTGAINRSHDPEWLTCRVHFGVNDSSLSVYGHIRTVKLFYEFKNEF